MASEEEWGIWDVYLFPRCRVADERSEIGFSEPDVGLESSDSYPLSGILDKMILKLKVTELVSNPDSWYLTGVAK